MIINYRGGGFIPIHVGQLPSPTLVNHVSDEHVAEVTRDPLLHEQGDGIKSYAGILFETLVHNKDITLIDEPEAFLHPPQMRRLGETLASEVVGQLFIATHSSDIMRGFLEGTKGDIRVLRIMRDGDQNHVTEADPDTIKKIWTTPILKYSNALDGIFHEQVIICEDHSDCRFYNAMADHMGQTDASLRHDTAYIPAGGKDAIPQIAEVLRQIGVPTKAVFDLDILDDQGKLERTVTAFGGEWADFEKAWKQVNAALIDKHKPPKAQEVKRDILDAIDRSNDEVLPKKEIVSWLNQSGGWKSVKELGMAAIPSGDDHKKLMQLIGGLEKIGIYVVPVGEIENFDRTLVGHGSKFVNRFLDQNALDRDNLDELRKFVRKIYAGKYAPLVKSDA